MSKGYFPPGCGNGRSQYLDAIDKQRFLPLQQIDSEEPASTGDEWRGIIRHGDGLASAQYAIAPYGLFDHFVSQRHQIDRQLDARRLRGLQIDDERIARRLLEWQVRRLRAL